MTTIAANKNSIACDLQITHASNMKLKAATKIFTIPEDTCKALFNVRKAYLGYCGNADAWGEVVAWLTTLDGKPPKLKTNEFLLFTDEKKIYHATNMTNWMQIDVPHFAIGSGMQYATAAMSAGATPLEACKIAGKHDTLTGMGYKEYFI